VGTVVDAADGMAGDAKGTFRAVRCTMAQIAAAVRDPSTSTVDRRPRSVRRTSHMDVGFLDNGGLTLIGASRDLRSSITGEGVVLGAARVRAVIGPTRLLEELQVSPDTDTAKLLGVTVSGGFRSVVDETVPEHREEHSPLYLLLDELPVVALISGYAVLYRGADQPAQPVALDSKERPSTRPGPRVDICAGWRGDGVMMTAIASGAGTPTPIGPAAPILEPPGDPLGWHVVPSLPAGSMRRRRLIDVCGDDTTLQVSAMFRDTHVDEFGVETVLHEYELEMEVDAQTMVVTSCKARPRTLPWPECPAAADSARRLAGHPVADLRSLIKAEFRGTSTCTHLNDLLRSLADVAILARSLD
jgi:Protein of unknown function (DUF2889)